MSESEPAGDAIAFHLVDPRSGDATWAMQQYFAELDEVWSRYEMRVQRLVPAGRQVAALCHLYAVGRESDLQVEEDSAVVFTVEAGKIVQIDAYPTHAEALEAAGLRE